jgi:hypothetical protein
MTEVSERPIVEVKTPENQNRILSSLGQMRRKFKKSDPAGYAVHMLKEAQYKHPENSQVYMQRVQRFLGKFYKKSLPR